MQKTVFLFPLLLLFLFSPLLAQEEFEGTLRYTVDLRGELAEMLQENEPNNALDLHYRQGEYIVNLHGGRMPKTYLYMNEADVELALDVGQKVAYKYSPHFDINRETHTQQEEPIAVNTGRSSEVQGMPVEVYRMRKDNIDFLFFVNDDYRVDLRHFEDKMRAKPFFLVDGLDGRIPLKIMQRRPGLEVTTEIKSIQPRELSAEQFAFPEGFELRNRDYRP